MHIFDQNHITSSQIYFFVSKLYIAYMHHTNKPYCKPSEMKTTIMNIFTYH